MTSQLLRRWMPLMIGVFASIFLVAWAVDQESHIQGSVFLPGGFPFQAYLPGRYTIYCDMDLKPKTEFMRVANIKSLPRTICDVRGAGHLSVLNVPVWHSGGLNRYIRSAYGDNSIRLLIPFAEFDILWPGTYEVRATFNGPGSGYFLMSIGPTSVVVTALLMSILILLSLFLYSFRQKKENEIGKKIRPDSSITNKLVHSASIQKDKISVEDSEPSVSDSSIESAENASDGAEHVKEGEAEMAKPEGSEHE